MNHWPFILGAYGITIFGTMLLSFSSWRAMRAAEARLAKMQQERAQ